MSTVPSWTAVRRSAVVSARKSIRSGLPNNARESSCSKSISKPSMLWPCSGFAYPSSRVFWSTPARSRPRRLIAATDGPGPAGRRLQSGWAHLTFGGAFEDGVTGGVRSAASDPRNASAVGGGTGGPRRRWSSRTRRAPRPGPSAPRARRSGAASPVLPDPVREPQDRQRRDGERQQRDAEPRPPEVGARSIGVAREPLLSGFPPALERGVEPPRLPQLVGDVRVDRAGVVALVHARRHATVRPLEAGEPGADAGHRARRAG